MPPTRARRRTTRLPRPPGPETSAARPRPGACSPVRSRSRPEARPRRHRRRSVVSWSVSWLFPIGRRRAVRPPADGDGHRVRKPTLLRLSAEALTDIEAHRDEETGDERVGQHPADHHGTEDAASDRAGTGGGPQRHAAQDKRERGHEEGAPTHTDAFERGVDERRSEEHTSELQSLAYLVCRLLLEKKK